MHLKYFVEACSDVYQYIIGNDNIIIVLLYYLNYVGYIPLSVRLRKLIFIVKVSDSSKNFIRISIN